MTIPVGAWRAQYVATGASLWELEHNAKEEFDKLFGTGGYSMKRVGYVEPDTQIVGGAVLQWKQTFSARKL